MERLRVAVDATPLLGKRTGVGAFVAGALGALCSDPDLDLGAFALSLRGGRSLPAHLPPGVRAVRRPAPAAPLLLAWSRVDVPPGTLWTGAADVVHGTNFAVPPTRGAGEVVTVHDLTPLRYPELASSATRPFPDLVRRAVGRGALVHTPSAFVAAEVVELLGVAPEQVRPIHHGIPPLAPPGPADRRLDGPYVLSLGRVEPRKGLPALIQAFDAVAPSHPGLRLVVAGPDGWGVDAFEAAVDRAASRDRVVRLGYVDDAERSALLRGAAVFAFPSVYEGFGFPPLEAMAAGVPVVAARAGAIPEVLGDAACLVPPGEADALAEALALVLDDEVVRAGLVARGGQRAGELSWERCAAGLAGLYREKAGLR